MSYAMRSILFASLAFFVVSSCGYTVLKPLPRVESPVPVPEETTAPEPPAPPLTFDYGTRNIGFSILFDEDVYATGDTVWIRLINLGAEILSISGFTIPRITVDQQVGREWRGYLLPWSPGLPPMKREFLWHGDYVQTSCVIRDAGVYRVRTNFTRGGQPPDTEAISQHFIVTDPEP